MTDEPSVHDLAIWTQLVEANNAFGRAHTRFSAKGVNRVALLRAAFMRGDRHLAMRMAHVLPIAEKQALFQHFIALASWDNGQQRSAFEEIVALPRDWVLERIEVEVERHLETGDDEAYRSFLPLYDLLDEALTMRLARRAAWHPDPHVRDAAESYLEADEPDSQPQ